MEDSLLNQQSNPFNVNIKTPDFDKFKKGGGRFIPIAVVIIIIAILAFNSIYSLSSGHEAVITRFGSHVRTERTPGLQFKLPFIESHHIVNVAEIRRLEFGTRVINGVTVTIPEESLMLTGEGHEVQVNGLVNADWVIQYNISNSFDFLFRVEDPEATIHSVTQAAYRRIVASHPLDAVLTDRRYEIQIEIRRELQDILDLYQIGVNVTAVLLQDASPPDQVRDAFLDVTRSLEDRISYENEAERYRNEQMPRAEGMAIAAINDAEAYREQRINDALGTVARFNAILEEYHNHPEIMRTRLYLEMIREVMPQIDRIYFLDSTNGGPFEILHLGNAMGGAG
jgi:membrane protease subunit HflK